MKKEIEMSKTTKQILQERAKAQADLKLKSDRLSPPYAKPDQSVLDRIHLLRSQRENKF